MSVISVNHLCRDITRDPKLRQAFLRDPKGELAKYPRKFTEAERAALLSGDVGTLYQMGVNAYLMGYLARYGIFGLTIEAYSERVRRSVEAKMGLARSRAPSSGRSGKGSRALTRFPTAHTFFSKRMHET
jgi:hypothetical protein